MCISNHMESPGSTSSSSWYVHVIVLLFLLAMADWRATQSSPKFAQTLSIALSTAFPDLIQMIFYYNILQRKVYGVCMEELMIK